MAAVLIPSVRSPLCTLLGVPFDPKQLNSQNTARRATAPTVGGWNDFQSGPLAGRVLRFSLQELQKADHGRKYGRKDKRPLDPPPVVQVKFFQLVRQGSMDQVEQEFDTYDEYDTFGLLCHVDLFPENSASIASGSPTARAAYPFQPSIPTPLGRMQWPSPFPRDTFPNSDAAGSMSYGAQSASEEPAIPFDVRAISRPNYGRSTELSGERVPEPWNTRAKPYIAPASAGQVGQGNHPDESKCTSLLSGETVVSCSLVEYDGKKAAMFAFPDIAVKREGRFILRYRIFNLHSRTREDDVHILAECFGGPFEVYSTKSFPGLQASTELTRRLSLSGVRVNSRHKERRGWKRDSHQARRNDADGSPTQGSPQSAQTAGSFSPLRKHTVLPNGAGVAPYAQGFSGDYSPFSHSAPPSAGMLPSLGEGLPRARSPGGFLAWTRIGGDAADMRGGDSCSTGTEEEGSTHSVW
ncbi:velvet factor-domain-containing protein [Dichomitus squalens]|uniref:Velvet factor-domain-containing protein n=1 Tax=Dichomitus squalens TaxID=114155 RepID=A0A4Q9MSA5_9APHY|nr:velvet factor-domain-containing protein [Dichomitus squalens]